MLIYLDTAQFAWIERVSPDARDKFLCEWHQLGCELALSLQLLQEAAKRGSDEDVQGRIETMKSLAPLRGIPAGSAGVMVKEVTIQMSELLGHEIRDPIAYGRVHLFPLMEDDDPEATVREYRRDFDGFNLTSAAQAELEAGGTDLVELKRSSRVDPNEIEHSIRSLIEALPDESLPVLQPIGEAVIRDVKEADGDVWNAVLGRWGLSTLKCVNDLHPEDIYKAAGFVEAARFAADDIAFELDISEEEVHALVENLRPYSAPGYGLEMAVSRARRAHSSNPHASDHVDEEHVSFAPYVDLLFADKRTVGYIRAEAQREDGRINRTAADKVVAARDLDDVLRQIRRRATPSNGGATGCSRES